MDEKLWNPLRQLQMNNTIGLTCLNDLCTDITYLWAVYAASVGAT